MVNHCLEIAGKDKAFVGFASFKDNYILPPSSFFNFGWFQYVEDTVNSVVNIKGQRPFCRVCKKLTIRPALKPQYSTSWADPQFS